MPSKPNPDETVREAVTFLIEFMEQVRDLKLQWEQREQRLIDDVMSEYPVPYASSRREHAHDVWELLREDDSVVTQGDYALLRTSLGRRRGQNGPPVDYALRFAEDPDGVWVSGSHLSAALGLVIRWGTDPGVGVVLPLTGATDSHLLPRDLLGEGALRIIAFDSTSVTGYGVYTHAAVDHAATGA